MHVNKPNTCATNRLILIMLISRHLFSRLNFTREIRERQEGTKKRHPYNKTWSRGRDFWEGNIAYLVWHCKYLTCTGLESKKFWQIGNGVHTLRDVILVFQLSDFSILWCCTLRISIMLNGRMIYEQMHTIVLTIQKEDAVVAKMKKTTVRINCLWACKLIIFVYFPLL